MTQRMTTGTDHVAQEFRLAMRRLASTVSIISTTDTAGRRHGMAATAVNSVTMDPPTVLVCVNRSASIHEPLLEREQFCINMLMNGHEDLVAAFSGKMQGEERFTLGEWRQDDATGMPYLDDAQSSLVCQVETVTPVGTHSVILARVLDARVADPVAPLLYADGRLARLAAPGA